METFGTFFIKLKECIMCNGWTNWETWKVSLEIFDGFETEEEVTADILQELTEQIVFEDIKKGSFVEPLVWSFYKELTLKKLQNILTAN